MASRVSIREKVRTYDEEAGARKSMLEQALSRRSSIGLSNISAEDIIFAGVDEDIKEIALRILQSMDIDGDGRLDMDEVGMGVIEAAKEAKQAALNQAMLVKKLKRANNRSMFMTFVMTVAVALLILMTVRFGNQQVESTIAKNTEMVMEGQATEVAVDPAGHAHLVDKSSQKDVSVQAEGVVANAVSRHLEGRELVCVPVHDVATIVHGLTTSTAAANLISHDNKGAIKDVILMSGDFHDTHNSLTFADGKVTIQLDSDACNIAEDDGEEDEAEMEFSEPESTTNRAPKDDTNRPAQTNDGESAGPFKRRLKPRTADKAVVSSDVLSRHRQLYSDSLLALREGRRLTGSYYVPVCTGGTCTSSSFDLLSMDLSYGGNNYYHTVTAKKIKITQNYPALSGPYNSDDKRTTLTFAEVQVFAGSTNIAVGKTASQSSTYPGYGSADYAIDGSLASFNHVDMTTDQAWWEVDLGQEYDVSRIVIHNRLDCCQYQNAGALVELYDNDNELVQSYSLGDTNGVASRTFYASDVKCSDGGCDELDGDISDVPTGSCNGRLACYRVDPSKLGEHSCNGAYACINAGDAGGSVTIGARSCLGVKVCTLLGRRNSNSVTIGDDSCVGTNACHGTGWSEVAVDQPVTIGEGSCVGGYACTGAGTSGTATIGDGSCLGNSVCHYAGAYFGAFGASSNTGTITIGDSSCKGTQACGAAGRQAYGTTTIGNGSCLGDGVCGNVQLTTIADGSNN